MAVIVGVERPHEGPEREYAGNCTLAFSLARNHFFRHNLLFQTVAYAISVEVNFFNWISHPRAEASTPLESQRWIEFRFVDSQRVVIGLSLGSSAMRHRLGRFAKTANAIRRLS